MGIRSWNILAPRGFTTFSIQTDRLAFGRKPEMRGIERILPFPMILRITAVESNSTITIQYRSINKVTSQKIGFTSVAERDDAFNTLKEILDAQFNQEAYRPKKWHQVLYPLIFLVFVFLLIAIAYLLREVESGKGLDLGEAKSSLDRIVHVLLKIIVLLFSLIGSKILFFIGGLSLFAIAATVIYLAITTPTQLPIQNQLYRKKPTPQDKQDQQKVIDSSTKKGYVEPQNEVLTKTLDAFSCPYCGSNYSASDYEANTQTWLCSSCKKWSWNSEGIKPEFKIIQKSQIKLSDEDLFTELKKASKLEARGNLQEAKKIYENIILFYGQTDFAKDAEICLALLEKEMKSGKGSHLK
jgi:hypothetical protein